MLIMMGYLEPEGFYGKTYQQYAQEILDDITETGEARNTILEQMFIEADKYWGNTSDEGIDVTDFVEYMQNDYGGFGFTEGEEPTTLEQLRIWANENWEYSFKTVEEMLISWETIDPAGYEEYLFQFENKIIKVESSTGEVEYVTIGEYIEFEVTENGKYTFTATGPEREKGELTLEIDNFYNFEFTGDWEALLKNANGNPEKYRHPDQGSDIGDIGIGTDGNPVNLNLWLYEKSAINDGICLGLPSLGCYFKSSYDNENIVEGKIIGKVPAYIKLEGETNFRPVTDLNLTFYGCNKLEVVPEFPKTIITMERTFYNCTNLTSITIPETVTNIGYAAFYNCTNLTSITIPESVTNIGYSAFYECTNLKSITIPKSVTSIGGSAFYRCTNLTSITIPENVTSIGSDIFGHCTSLTSVTIPESVTNIGAAAFYNCTNLNSIILPKGITNIDDYTFYKCTNLTSITIPESVTSIGKYAFYSCNSIKEVNYLGTQEQWNNISINSTGNNILNSVKINYLGE